MALFKGTVNASDVSGSHTDFPAFIDLSQMPAAFWNIVSNGGGDIRCYADQAKITELPREVVSCDTGAETGELHVKVGTLDDSTEVFIDVDGARSEPAADSTFGSEVVWSDYAAVWHLDSTTDSTGNGNTLSANGGITVGGTTGPLGAATAFDGSNDYLNATDDATLDVLSGDFTLQSWVYTTKTAFQPYLNKGVRDGGSPAYAIDLGGDSAFYGLIQDNSSLGGFTNTGGGAYSTATWYLHHGAFDRDGNLVVYVDGSSVATTDISSQSSSIDTSQGVFLGTRSDLNSWLQGRMQEVRLRKSLLSSNWITTENNNQSDPASFWTWEEIAVVASPAIFFGANF